MAEIEITLPTVQYGNVKLKTTIEELGMAELDAGTLGSVTAVFLNLFSQGFKVGSQIDVDWQGADVSALPRDTLEQAASAIKDVLGATEVPDPEDNVDPDGPETSDDAPWKKKVDSKAKPWETSGAAPAAPAVASIDW